MRIHLAAGFFPHGRGLRLVARSGRLGRDRQASDHEHCRQCHQATCHEQFTAHLHLLRVICLGGYFRPLRLYECLASQLDHLTRRVGVDSCTLDQYGRYC